MGYEFVSEFVVLLPSTVDKRQHAFIEILPPIFIGRVQQIAMKQSSMLHNMWKSKFEIGTTENNDDVWCRHETWAQLVLSAFFIEEHGCLLFHFHGTYTHNFDILLAILCILKSFVISTN